MSGNLCLKPYFKFNSNSCWIDSLFVSLFHNENILIGNFVNNLKLNNVINITSEQKKIGQDIINEIINTYDNINIFSINETCNNIRVLLNNHLTSMRESNYIIDDNYYRFTSVHNNSMDVLKYLFFHIFDLDSSNKITSYSWNYNDYYINNFESIQNFHTNLYGNLPTYKDINFINLIHNVEEYEYLKKYELKDKLDNCYLHSIIAHIGKHYICYYKCSSNWYKYDDLGIIDDPNDRTQLIGDLKNVMIDYYNIIKNLVKENTNLKENKHFPTSQLQLILLYLKIKPDLNQGQGQGHGQDRKSRRQSQGQGQGQGQSQSQGQGQGQEQGQQKEQDIIKYIKIKEQIAKDRIQYLEHLEARKQITAQNLQQLAKEKQQKQQEKEQEEEQEEEYEYDPIRQQIAKKKEELNERKSRQLQIKKEEHDRQLAIQLAKELEEEELNERKTRRLQIEKDNEKLAKQFAKKLEQKYDEKYEQEELNDKKARQLARQLEQEELNEKIARQLEQEELNEKIARQLQREEYKNLLGGGIRIINNRCDESIKNINNSNCNQKIQKIQKIQYVRDELIENMNKFFNKKLNN